MLQNLNNAVLLYAVLKARCGLNANFRFVGGLQRVHFQALFVVGVHLGNPLSTCVDGFFVADVKLGVGAQPIVGLFAVAFKHLENRGVVLALHFGVGPQRMVVHGHVLGDWVHNRQTNAKIGVL